MEEEIQQYKTHLEQLKRVQEAGKVGYWAVYVEKELLEWSPETYKLFDLPPGTPTTYTDMLTYVHPEDKNWVDQMWQKAMKDGDYAVVYRIISAEKKIKWIEVYGDIVFDQSGNFMRALGIVRDISEQKEKEIELAALASSLKHSQKIGNLGSWQVNSNSPNIQLNEEALAIFGFPVDRPITLDDWVSSIHEEDRDNAWRSWKRATRGESDYEIEYRIIVDDSVRWVKAVGEIELDSKGKFLKGVGVVRDITEHIAQQEALRLAKEQAEAANKLKSVFLANMSHEIRTPLNGIIGFSELLMKSNLNEKQKQYMTTVNQSAHSLMGIINDILDISKIEAGRMELVQEKVDLYELANQVKDIISYQAQKKHISIWVKIESQVPRYILTDGLRLQQVLVNLMSNAVKFTPEGEVELKIEARGNDLNKVFRFSVRDTGIGVSQENQRKIFEAFSQEDSSTTKEFGGTGLGLNICNGILALMGSRIQLEAIRGKGSLFYFDVHFESYEENEVNSSLTENVTDPGDLTTDNTFESLKLKVLIVEDNKVNSMLFKILVQELLPNATILEADDGKQAVDLFEEEHPDLILMDVQMAVMNGYESSRAIREIERTRGLREKKQTPILALTAGTMEGDREKCLEAGMDDFIGKPVIDNIFKSILKKWVLHINKAT